MICVCNFSDGFHEEKRHYFSEVDMEKLNRFEPWIYGLFLAIHLIPVLLFSPFVTLDGPVHLYNSHLVNWMTTGSSGLVNRFFVFNHFPEPNWIGHFIETVLLSVFTAGLSEKILLLLILVIGASGFRKLCGLLNPGNKWLSWLYFPFMYNFTFSLGFFNFSFGFALIFWIIYYWIKYCNQLNLKKSSLIGTLLLIIYFSHLVMFLVALIFCGVISLCRYYKNRKFAELKSLIILSALALPGLIFSLLFVLKSGTAGYRNEITWLTKSELLKQIVDARMFIVYNYADESGFARLFFFAMLIFTCTAIYYKKFTDFMFPFLMIALISLLLVFIIPDAMASGGILSVRMVQLFYSCWCIWLMTALKNQKTSQGIAVFSVLFSLTVLYNSLTTRNDLSKFASQYVTVAEQLKEESIVLPLNYGNNWLHANLPAYIASGKKMIVLDNYESTAGHFPLLWKDEMNPEIHLGNFAASNKPCIRIKEFEKYSGQQIDYITIEALPDVTDDSCTKNLKEQLNEMFIPMHISGVTEIKVYERKNASTSAPHLSRSLSDKMIGK